MFTKPKTVESVVSNITKSIDELDEIQHACIAKDRELSEQIARLGEESAANAEERDRADRIAAKLSDLIK